MANAALEDELREVEEGLVRMREEVAGVNRERKRMQEGGRKEVCGGEEEWRGGVGRLVEVLLGEEGVGKG